MMLVLVRGVACRFAYRGPGWRFVFVVIVAGHAVLAGNVAEARKFYSVNERGVDHQGPDDELVVVDSETGAVSVVGSLGMDVIFPTLTMHNGRLFGRTSATFDGETLLMEIDRSTGAVIPESLAFVTVDGARPHFAEAIADRTGDLMISYQRAGNGTQSNAIGFLGLDGTVSQPIGFPLATDVDALAFDSLGVGFAFNQFEPTLESSKFLQVDLRRGAIAELGVVDSALYWGIAITPNDQVFGIERADARRLTHFDRTGAAVSSVSYPGQYHLIGLAAIPEPATHLLCAALAWTIGLRRRRRSTSTVDRTLTNAPAKPASPTD